MNSVPAAHCRILPAFQRLSDCIGPDRVIWRYDPIFLSETYSMAHHLHYFEKLARRLSPYTKKCTISFLDFYRGTARKMAPLAPIGFSAELQNQLAKSIAEIAHSYGLQVDTCAEGIDLRQYGIEHARCIDGRLFGRLLGCPLEGQKDKNQRPACGCMASLDIGVYRSCPGGCRYCYANDGEPAAEAIRSAHNPASPLLIGDVGAADRITERKMSSCRVRQLRFD